MVFYLQIKQEANAALAVLAMLRHWMQRKVPKRKFYIFLAFREKKANTTTWQRLMSTQAAQLTAKWTKFWGTAEAIKNIFFSHYRWYIAPWCPMQTTNYTTADGIRAPAVTTIRRSHATTLSLPDCSATEYMLLTSPKIPGLRKLLKYDRLQVFSLKTSRPIYLYTK